MTKIQDINYGAYQNPEDRITAALLQIMHYGGHKIISNLFGDLVDLPSDEISVISQSSQKKSRPDGEIKSQCHYHIFIESKIKSNSINLTQLRNHLTLVNPTQAIFLIYLTPDTNKPHELVTCGSGVEWMSWDDVCTKLKNYKDEANSEILCFLIDQFILLYNNIVVIRPHLKNEDDNSFDEELQKYTHESTVIIVGGRWGEDIASKYGFYACQPNRFFYNARFIAFCHHHRIENLFRIKNDPYESIDIQKVAEVPRDYFTNEEPHYTPQPRKLFLLEHIKKFDPAIINDKTDKNNKPCAFTQRQTYTTYEKIIKAKYTSEL